MDSKTIAWVSYITLVGWIVALVSHNGAVVKSSLAVFHLRQAFGLMVTYIACWFIGMILLFIIPFIGIFFWVVYIALLVFWVLGLIAAVNGEEKPLPIVGPLFQQWFTFIK